MQVRILPDQFVLFPFQQKVWTSMKSYSDYAMGRDTAAKSATRRQLLIANGLCPKCGVNRPAKNRRCCAGCLEQQRLADKSIYRSKRARLVAEGLCVRCGLNPPADGKQSCEDCREKNREYERKKILKKDKERKNREAVEASRTPVHPLPVQTLPVQEMSISNFDDLYFPPGSEANLLFRSLKEKDEAIRKGVTGNEWFYSFHNKHSPISFGKDE